MMQLLEKKGKTKVMKSKHMYNKLALLAFKHILRVISGSDYMSDIAVAKDLDDVHRGKSADEDK